MDWRKIPGYENYEVSSAGQVRKGIKIMKFNIDRAGYYITRLSKDGIQKTIKTHRLVASLFIPNPENKRTVDHIDRDKTNNHIENLRWADNNEQNLNRFHPTGVSGEKYILHKSLNYWEVRIQRHNIRYCQGFSSLPEAIAARDNYLASIIL